LDRATKKADATSLGITRLARCSYQLLAINYQLAHLSSGVICGNRLGRDVGRGNDVARGEGVAVGVGVSVGLGVGDGVSVIVGARIDRCRSWDDMLGLTTL
jgi:hypothetical protein